MISWFSHRPGQAPASPTSPVGEANEAKRLQISWRKKVQRWWKKLPKPLRKGRGGSMGSMGMMINIDVKLWCFLQDVEDIIDIKLTY